MSLKTDSLDHKALDSSAEDRGRRPKRGSEREERLTKLSNFETNVMPLIFGSEGFAYSFRYVLASIAY